MGFLNQAARFAQGLEETNDWTRRWPCHCCHLTWDTLTWPVILRDLETPIKSHDIPELKIIDSSLAPVLASSKIDSYMSLSKIFGIGVISMGMVHHEVLDIALGVETSTLRDTVKEDKATGKMRL